MGTQKLGVCRSESCQRARDRQPSKQLIKAGTPLRPQAHPSLQRSCAAPHCAMHCSALCVVCCIALCALCSTTHRVCRTALHYAVLCCAAHCTALCSLHSASPHVQQGRWRGVSNSRARARVCVCARACVCAYVGESLALVPSAAPIRLRSCSPLVLVPYKWGAHENNGGQQQGRAISRTLSLCHSCPPKEGMAI